MAGAMNHDKRLARAGPADHEAVLDDLQRCLSGDFAIEHLTFQLETEGRERAERASHR